MSFLKVGNLYLWGELEVPQTPKPHWCNAWSISKGFRKQPYTSNPSIFDSLCRIDAPGALHHIIVRGIERKDIFEDDTEKSQGYDIDKLTDRVADIFFNDPE